MSTRQKHVLLVTVIAALAVFISVWLWPYLKLYGHERVCIALYILLVFAYFYLRPSSPRFRRPERRNRTAQ